MIININSKKASQDTDIPRRIVKENAYVMIDFFSSSYDNAVVNCNFRSSLKDANVVSIFKKDTRMEATKYWSVATLYNLSKIFERIMQCKSAYFSKILYQSINMVLGKVIDHINLY